VDANPMAVQLAQLSLWLATLAAGRPLSFLDHHFLCGDSLIGASPVEVMRQRPGRSTRRQASPAPLDVFFDAVDDMRALVPLRREIEAQADDSAATVRRKERSLADCRTLPG